LGASDGPEDRRAKQEPGGQAGPLWSWGLFVVATLWLGGTLVAPFAASRGWLIAPFLYLLYQPICHQMPERSFELWGHQAAACHRCVGLYAGFLVGLLMVPGWIGLRRVVARRPIVIVLFALPLVADVALWNHNVWWSRFFTGVVAAVPLALLAQWGARDLRRRWRG
jgi:uncharacterized membrane protein